MRYQAVIFDLDGVICHTDASHFEAWKAVAEELGIPFDEEKNNRLRGVSRMESLEILLGSHSGSYSNEEKKELAEKKNRLYRQRLAAMSPADLPENVKNTLEGLRQLGLRLGIGSSSKNAGYILERIGLKDYFDAVCDGNGIRRSKPDPEVFRKAAELLGLEAGECLVVEDAIAGIEAACAGDFDSAGIGEAARYGKTTYALDSIEDLLKLMY